jgi:transposase
MVEVPVPYPRVETPKRLGVYLIADNYLAHEHAKVRAWPKRHAPFHMHFTPTCASWLNHIERFFGLITADHVRCEVFKIIPELVERLEGDSR